MPPFETDTDNLYFLNFGFNFSKQTEKEEKMDLLDKEYSDLKKLRELQGYLLMEDVIDIFDLKDPKLYDGTCQVNPFEIYCGDLDKYKKAIKKKRDDCLLYIEHGFEVHENIKRIHLINKALDGLEGITEYE